MLGLQQTGTHIDSWAWGRDLESPEALAATYLGDRGEFLIGELDGVIVAMGALRPFDETPPRDEPRAGRPEPSATGFRRGHRGAARAARAAADQGAVRLDTTAGQQPTIAMYRKLGYDEIGRGSLPALRCLVDGEAAQLTSAGAARHCSRGSSCHPHGVTTWMHTWSAPASKCSCTRRRDGRFVAPHDDAVDQPVAPAVGEVSTDASPSPTRSGGRRSTRRSSGSPTSG